MEHGKKLRKFGRETKLRKALIRDLAQALILNNKITTTEAKAKSLRPFIEKVVTKSKVGNVATIRTLTADFGKTAAQKLIKEVGSKFAEQNGGYTRIISLPRRVSDGSKMAMIEFVK